MERNNQIKGGKDLQDQETQAPSELKVQPRALPEMNPSQPSDPTIPSSHSHFCKGFPPLENEQFVGAEPIPGCVWGHRGWQGLPAMQEPGWSRMPRGGIYVQGQEPPPAPPEPGLGWLLGKKIKNKIKKSQFWMHRGFIPVLPHCIGKCNSLAWESGG